MTAGRGRPHVVLVVADDMGYSDLGCYGGEIATPALDRLGRAGVRFSRFYNTTRCSPSRASLLTGLHPHQTGIGILTNDDRPHGYPGSLNDRCVTLAEVLRQAGYATCLSGKWHLASEVWKPSDNRGRARRGGRTRAYALPLSVGQRRERRGPALRRRRAVPRAARHRAAIDVGRSTVTYPSSYAGHDPLPLEGRSMLPALRGDRVEPGTLYWEHIGNAAIRRGRWKLVREHGLPWELYDMDVDRAELVNEAATHAEVVNELAAAWQTWAVRVGVIPWERVQEIYHAESRGDPAA